MKKFLSLLLAVLMVLSCAAMAETTEARTDTIVFGTSSFGQKFSPFFAANAYDMDVVSLTQGALLASDRGGNVVRNGIEGETINYNGTDYTYYGMGDVEATAPHPGNYYIMLSQAATMP